LALLVLGQDRVSAYSRLEKARYTALPAHMSDMDLEEFRFNHTEVNAGTRVLIKTTCRYCGMSMLLSAADGSLQKWERWHECDRVILAAN